MEERNIAEHEAHANFDSHEGHRQSRQELQDTTGKEGDAQGRHGCLRVRIAECTQVGARTLLTTKGSQSWQARHQVQELGSQALHGIQFVLGGGLREPTDEDHEDRDEGDDQESDESRPEVEEKDHAQSGGCHRRDEDQLGQEGNEVGA